MKFQSNYFTTVDDLCASKTAMEGDLLERRKRQRIIRQFANGLATMSDEEARATGNTEIVNHLTTHRFLLQRKRRLEQPWTTSRVFTEVKVDTDNPEQDALLSLRFTQVYNKFCIYSPDGMYGRFIKAGSGEIQIAGGFPVMRYKMGSWQPKLALNILFPKGAGVTVSDIPYAQAPEEFTLADLEALLESIKGEEGVNTSKKAVQNLINWLKKKPKGESAETGSFSLDSNSKEKIGSVVDRNDSNRNATVDVWWYYEVKTRDDNTQYVSGTLFNDRLSLDSDDKTSDVGPQIIAYFDKLFDTPEEWLQIICMDMEIGGDITMDSIRGVAEIMYPSASEIEILINLMLSGDKERARPKYQVSSTAVADEVLGWDSVNDTIVPGGVTAFDIKSSSAPLQTNINMLMGTAAGLGGGEVSNSGRGGELRQQAVARQQANAVMQFGDMSDWTTQLENVELVSVERVFVGKCRRGCRGYQQMMQARACMEKYGVDLKKLFVKEHGALKYITVRVRRVLGDGGLDSEQTTSKFLLDMAPRIAPQNRPKIYQRAIALVTQDPDLAEDLVTIPQPIINAQKLTAENERDTIMHRALLGQPITTNKDDVDMDHIPVHMMDLLALLSLHQLQPWGKLQVIQFAGLQRHTQDHFENVLGDKSVRDEALALLPQFQQIINAAQAIVQQVEMQEGAAEQQLSPKEQADMQVKLMELDLKARQLGVVIENNQSLERQRLARVAQVSRSSYVKELETATRAANDRRRLQLEESRTAAQNAKTATDIKVALNPPEPAATG